MADILRYDGDQFLGGGTPRRWNGTEFVPAQGTYPKTLPLNNEMFIYGTYSGTISVGDVLGSWGGDAVVTAVHVDRDHTVVQVTGGLVGESTLPRFNHTGTTVVFGSRFYFNNAFQNAPLATIVTLYNTVAIRTQDWYMSALKLYVLDDLVATYEALGAAVSGIGEILSITDYLNS